MRIQSIRLINMGPHHDKTFEIRDGLHVVYGRNEAGKSTLLAAIRGALFGQATLSDGQVNVRPGAMVHLQLIGSDGKSIRLERSLSHRAAPRITYADGVVETGHESLKRAFPELQKVEQLMFDTFFTMQLSDLVAFSEKPSQIANQLFGIRAPLVNPYEFERQLQEEQRTIFNSSRRASKPHLNALEKRRMELLKKLRTSHDRAAWYRQQVEEKNACELELDNLARELRELEQVEAFWQQCADLRDKALAFCQTETALASLGTCPPGNPVRWSHAGEWARELDELKAGREETKRQLARLEEELQHLSTPEDWLQLRQDIERQARDCDALHGVLTEWERAVQGIEAADLEIQSALRWLPPGWTDTEASAFSQPSSSYFQLRDTALQLDSCRQAVVSAEARLLFANERVDSIRVQIQAEGCELPADATTKERLVEISRRDRQLSQSCEEIKSDIHALDMWLRQEVQKDGIAMPQKLAFQTWVPGLAAVVVGGVALVQWTQHQFVNVSILGATSLGLLLWMLSGWKGRKMAPGTAVPVFLRTIPNAPSSRQEAVSVLAQLKQTLMKVETEREDLSQLHILVSSLHQAEEEMYGWASEHASLAQQYQLYEQRYHAQLSDARIPITLGTGDGLDTLFERVQSVHAAQKRLKQEHMVATKASTRWGQFIADLYNFVQSASILRTDLTLVKGLDEAHREPGDVQLANQVFSQIHAALSDWGAVAKRAYEESVQRQALLDKRNVLSVELARCQERIARLEDQLCTVFQQLGVVSEDEYHAVMQREEERQRLVELRHRHQQDLTVACAGERQAARVVAAVRRLPLALIERHASESKLLREQKTTELTNAQNRVWAIQHALDQSVIGKAGASERWELAQLEAKQRALATAYASRKLAELLSRKARIEVEEQQMSPMMQIASQYFKDMTDGRYQSVRMPLGSTAYNELYVVDERGASWRVQSLSRGTREQVYLSLRLAVIRQYHEQSITLPVVLDDPFVNFDDMRTCRVLDILEKESHRYPIIYLTCHQHIFDAIQSRKEANMISIL